MNNNNTIRLRAGIIPYYIHPRTQQLLMLFMIPAKPQYGGNKPQCCKGKVEDGETLYDAALREGFEELGLFEANINEVKSLNTKIGTTSFFSASINDPQLFGIPHFETKETTWLTYQQYHERGRKLHFPVVKELYDTYKKDNE